MVLNRQGKRRTLSKHWELSTNSSSTESFTRPTPLSSLINQFNNQRTASKAINPVVKETLIKANLPQQNSFSEKSVKAFIQENKLKKKGLELEKPKQIFPAFGPKSFRVDTAKKTDLSEAFSKLILSRQNDNKLKKFNEKKVNDLVESTPNRLVALKPVEVNKLKPEFEEAVVPLKSIESKKALFNSMSSEQLTPNVVSPLLKSELPKSNNLKKICQMFQVERLF